MANLISVTEVCTAANCKQSTLRAWRNRNGFLPHLANEGWTKYKFSDAVAVCAVAHLTSLGFSAQNAVNAANQMHETIVTIAVEGDPALFILAMSYDGEFIDWRRTSHEESVGDAIGLLEDPVKILLDMGRVRAETTISIAQQRGFHSSSNPPRTVVNVDYTFTRS